MRYPINDFPRNEAGSTELAGQSTPSSTASTPANDRFNELLYAEPRPIHPRECFVCSITDHVNGLLDQLDALDGQRERIGDKYDHRYYELRDELLTLEEEHGSPVTELLYAAGLPTQHEPSP